MRIKGIVVRLVFALLIAAAPLLAVTNGVPDGNGHPFVGVVIQFIPNTDFITVCSGWSRPGPAGGSKSPPPAGSSR